VRADPERHLGRLPEELRASAHVFANGEVAWSNEHACSAINALANAGLRVLGLDARTMYPDGGVMETPVSAWTATDAPREDQVEQCRAQALEALPAAIDQGTHALITWD
jgi:hypothetical protein